MEFIRGIDKKRADIISVRERLCYEGLCLRGDSVLGDSVLEETVLGRLY